MKKRIQAALNAAGYRIERVRPQLPGKTLFLLDYLLHILNEKCKGDVSFIQMGANDGVQEDPCYAWIHRFPWRGVLVEPQANLAAQLRKIYRDNPSIQVEQSIIANEPGTATLYCLRESRCTPIWASGIASLDKAAILQHRHKIPNFDQLLTEVTLPAITFNQLADKYALSTVDYLQIDCEGYDFQILKSIDFDKLKPAVICYEHANLSPDDNAACRSLLAKHGYHFASWLGDTAAALPELFPVSDDRKRFLLD